MIGSRELNWLLTGLSIEQKQAHKKADAKAVIGATASAMIFSVIEIVKENGIKPFEYLVHLLKILPNADVSNQAVLDSLMPWSEAF